MLGVLAGVYIGFGALLMLSCGGSCFGLAKTDPGLKMMISGLMGLPTGLLMVLVAGGELFTGNTVRDHVPARQRVCRSASAAPVSMGVARGTPLRS